MPGLLHLPWTLLLPWSSLLQFAWIHLNSSQLNLPRIAFTFPFSSPWIHLVSSHLTCLSLFSHLQRPAAHFTIKIDLADGPL